MSRWRQWLHALMTRWDAVPQQPEAEQTPPSAVTSERRVKQMPFKGADRRRTPDAVGAALRSAELRRGA